MAICIWLRGGKKIFFSFFGARAVSSADSLRDDGIGENSGEGYL